MAQLELELDICRSSLFNDSDSPFAILLNRALPRLYNVSVGLGDPCGWEQTVSFVLLLNLRL